MKQHSRTLLLAGLLSLTLTSCGSRPAVAPVTSLPSPPAFAKPVVCQKVKIGDDLRVVAARKAACHRRANGVISQFVLWYNESVKLPFETRGEEK